MQVDELASSAQKSTNLCPKTVLDVMSFENQFLKKQGMNFE